MVAWPRNKHQCYEARERLGMNLQRVFPASKSGSFDALLQAIDEADLRSQHEVPRHA